MRHLIAAACLFAASPAISGDISVDAKVAGGVAVVTAKTDGKTVVFVAKDDGLTSAVPAELLNPKVAVYTGKPGVYRVLAITAIGDKPAFAEVTFTIQGPEPPVNPPGPPAPPAPIDDLPKRLRDAYAIDASPGKRGQLINLTAIYSTMADHAANDDSIKTSRTLLDVLNKVKAGMLVDGVLMDVRRICSAEIVAAIGSPNDLPLDRARAAAAFSRIKASLPSPE